MSKLMWSSTSIICHVYGLILRKVCDDDLREVKKIIIQ